MAAMKPFVDIEQLKASLGMAGATVGMGPSASDTISDGLTKAVIGTQIYFEELLQTHLMRQTNEDIFKVDDNLLNITPDGFWRLRLKNGFVRDPKVAPLPIEPDIQVFWADNYPALMINGGILLDITKAEYFVNKGKGIVHVAENFRQKFFRVTYASGFDGAKDAPEWLKEAIAAYVPVLITQKQVLNRADKATELYDQGKKHAFALMSQYMRDVGMVFRPLT